MNATFSEEELLLFYYGEAEAELATNLRAALVSDSELNFKYDNLKSMLSQLEPASENPNPTNLRILMEESVSSTFLAEC